MPLGSEVGLGPGHIVLYENPPPLPKGAQPPIFDPCLLWPKGRPSQLLPKHLLGLAHGSAVLCFVVQYTSHVVDEFVTVSKHGVVNVSLP